MQRPDIFLIFYNRIFYRAPTNCKVITGNVSYRYLSFFFHFFSRKSIDAFSTRCFAPYRTTADQPYGLSTRRPWPHFEYRALAHGRWGDQWLSIHSIRSNSFNYVKHAGALNTSFIFARVLAARRWRRWGGQEQRLFKED